MDISQAPEHLSMTMSLVLSSGSDPGSFEIVTQVRSGVAAEYLPCLVINRSGVVVAVQHTVL